MNVSGNSGFDRMSMGSTSEMGGMGGVDSRPPPGSEDQSIGDMEGQSGAQGFDFASQETGESSGFDFESTPPAESQSYDATTDSATSSSDDAMTDMMTSLQAMLDNIFTLFSTEDDTSTS